MYDWNYIINNFKIPQKTKQPSARRIALRCDTLSVYERLKDNIIITEMFLFVNNYYLPRSTLIAVWALKI